MTEPAARQAGPERWHVTPWQRAVSAYHGFWLAVSEAIGFSRGAFSPAAARQLPVQPLLAQLRIEAMRRLFHVSFEEHLPEDAALNSYACLDLLARTFDRAGLRPPRGGVAHDVGCASFWNARALHVFFAPDRLVGVEIEGSRLLRGWHSRRDVAAGHVRGLAGAEFVVADYTDYREPADVITAFYPFVAPGPVLAWRLPLRLLRPGALFARIAANLKPGGLFVMVNHGPAEAVAARDFALAAGLQPILAPVEIDPVWRRPQPPFVSLWRPPLGRPA